MKRISKYISSALTVAAIGVTMTACDDWTEPESVDLDYGNIETANPAEYAKYLENLRAYRNTDHKKVYAWFDNLETAFGSQGHRISAIPDSVDVIVLQNPDKVTNQMIEEMYQARVDKGQQFSYCISLDEIQADYTLLCEELAAKRLEWIAANGDEATIPAELEDPDVIRYIAQSTAKKLDYFNAVGFDAIMAGFTGKSTLHLTDDELADYTQKAGAFLGVIKDWMGRNQGVTLDFIGKPQYVDADLLGLVRMAFLSDALNATNTNMYSICLAEAGNALPESKLGMVASIPTEDGKVGIFSNGRLAVDAVAEWTAAHGVGAVGIQNTGYDYFRTNGAYTAVRALIETVNPSAK